MAFNVTEYVAFKNGRGDCPSCSKFYGKKGVNGNLSLVPGTDGAYKCFRGCTPAEIREACGYRPDSSVPAPKSITPPIPKPTATTYGRDIIEKNHQNLENGTKVALQAREWLSARGIDAEMRQHFKLGIARRKIKKGDQTIHTHSIDIPLPSPDGRYYRKGRLAPWDGLKGWTQYGVPRTVYFSHFPDEPQMTYLCAGEWDAIMLGWRMRTNPNIAVACFTCGEGNVPSAEVLAQLPGEVVIFYDLDQPGRTGATEVARALGERGKIATVPAPEDAPEGWDISDCLNAGYAPGQIHLAATEAVAPEPEPEQPNLLETEIPQPVGKPKSIFDRLISNDELMARAPDLIDYLVPDLMTSNELFVLATAPRGGKSLMAMALAHAVATGNKFLGRPCTQGPVIYVNIEDSDAKIKIRQQQQGWGEGLPIYWLDKFGLSELPDLINAAKQIEPRLIIIDTLSRVNDSSVSEKSSEMTNVLAPLQDFAKDSNCAVLVVHHTKKLDPNTPTIDIFDTLRGSTAIRATARGVWILATGESNSHRLVVEHGHGKQDLNVYLNLVNLTWTNLGEWKPNADADQSERILAYLNANGEATAVEIADAMNIPKRSCQTVLWRLQSDGLIRKRGGKGRDPAIYSRPVTQLNALDTIVKKSISTSCHKIDTKLTHQNLDGVRDRGVCDNKNPKNTSAILNNKRDREEILRPTPENPESVFPVDTSQKQGQTDAEQGLGCDNFVSTLSQPVDANGQNREEILQPSWESPQNESRSCAKKGRSWEEKAIVEETEVNNPEQPKLTAPPVGTWVRRLSDNRYYKCIDTYPHGGGCFQTRQHEPFGYISPDDYEIVENPNKRITPGDVVRLSSEAFEFARGRGMEIEADWTYQTLRECEEGDRMVEVKRVSGGRSGRRNWAFPFGALEVVD